MPLPQKTLLQNTPKVVRKRTEKCSIRTKQQGKFVKDDKYGNVFEIRYHVKCLDGDREVILRYIGKQKPGLKKNEQVFGIPANDSPLWVSCLSEDTLIWTSKGLIPIKDVYINSLVQAKDNIQLCNNVLNQGNKDVFEVITRNGYKIKGTHDHKIKIFNKNLQDVEWKKIDELTKDDYVLIKIGSDLCFPNSCKFNDFIFEPTKINKISINDYDKILDLYNSGNFTQYQIADYFNVAQTTISYLIRNGYSDKPTGTFNNVEVPIEMNDSLAYILGYLLSEGNINNNRIVFSNSNYELIEHYCKCYKSVFNRKPWIFKDKSGVFSATDKSIKIVSFLQHIGLLKKLAKEKEVPWSILQSSEKHIICFICSFWEGDGSLKYPLNAVSSSIKLIEQLQQLLLRLGIISQINKGKSNKNSLGEIVKKIRKWYKLEVTGRDTNLFLEKVGYISKISENEVSLYKNIRRQIRSPKTLIPGLPAKYNKWWQKPKYGYFSDLDKNHHLKRYEGNYFFDKIKNINYVGKENVYDLSIQSEHCFVANGFIAHNCSCPFHLFYVEYALAQYGNTDILYSNGQPPVIKNPEKIPYVCKHSFLALQTAVEEYKDLGKMQDVLNSVELTPAPAQEKKPEKPIIPEEVIDTIQDDLDRVEEEVHKQPSPQETPEQIEQKEKKTKTIFERIQKAIDRIKNTPPFKGIRNVIDRLKKKIFKNKPRKENIEVQDVDDLKKELELIEDVNESKEANVSSKLLYIASLLDD